MIRISFDAMGGDYAPKEIVKGAYQASEELGIKALIVGNKRRITKILKKLKADLDSQNIEIVDAPSVIGMDEKNPAKAIKTKRDSSLVLANQLVVEDRADAVISAGNTGAATAASLFILKRIKGFERPCICTMIPTKTSKMLLVDAGSNISASAEQIHQTALLGNFMANAVLNINKPRIGLLNIGEEPGKGTDLYKDTFNLLDNDYRLNFIGNVEGKTIIDNICDVAVCDGFTGNIHLKALEGGLKMMVESFKKEFSSSVFAQIAGLIMKLSGAFDRIKAHFDPSSYGGALLGGLNYPSLISHGSSNAEAIYNAAKHAKLLVEAKVVENLKKEFANATSET